MNREQNVTGVTKRNMFSLVRRTLSRNERNNTLWGVTLVTVMRAIFS